MVKYIEYNLINNIPIIYPNHNPIKYTLCPRYAIADSDKILKCFHAPASEIMIQNVKFKYIKIDINKKFRTMNNEIEALYCYVIMDYATNYDIDYSNFNKLNLWLNNDVNNHYMMVTTPVLRYKDIFYNIANDNSMSVINHNTVDEPVVMDEHDLIRRLIVTNCFTICDNFNIIIALYHEKYISKTDFVTATVLLEQHKYFYYTPSIWMQYMNNHRIPNACDVPILHLSLKPHMIDRKIIELYDWIVCNNYSIYMTTVYKYNTLFTTIISCSYPHLNTNMLRIILGHNIQDKLWISHKNDTRDFELFDDYTVLCPDFYGLFASFCYINSMWKLWSGHKKCLLQKLLQNYHQNVFCLLSDVLVPLFRLYTIGYEDIKIKRQRVHKLWTDIIQIIDMDRSVLSVFLEYYITSDNAVHIPYVFLLDIYNEYHIDLMKHKKMYVHIANKYVCQYTSLYNVLQYHTCKDNLYYFHKNVIKKRMMVILLCIYKKFDMFGNSPYNKDMYCVGCLLLSYLQNNMYYLV